MKNKFLVPAIFSAFLLSALPVSAYALDGAICDKDAYPSLAGQVQCLKDKLSAVMDKIGSTDPSASKEDIATLKAEQDKSKAEQTQVNSQVQTQFSQLQSQNQTQYSQIQTQYSQLQSQIQALSEAKSKDDTPTGTTKTFVGDASTVPSGWVLTDGLYFSAKEHPKLAAFVKDTYGPVAPKGNPCGYTSYEDYTGVLKVNQYYGAVGKSPEKFSDQSMSNETDYQTKNLQLSFNKYCTVKSPYDSTSNYIYYSLESDLHFMPTFKDANGYYLIMKD